MGKLSEQLDSRSIVPNRDPIERLVREGALRFCKCGCGKLTRRTHAVYYAPSHRNHGNRKPSERGRPGRTKGSGENTEKLTEYAVKLYKFLNGREDWISRKELKANWGDDWIFGKRMRKFKKMVDAMVSRGWIETKQEVPDKPSFPKPVYYQIIRPAKQEILDIDS